MSTRRQRRKFTSNSNVFLEWSQTSEGTAQIELRDINGKILLQQEHFLNDPLLELKLDHLAEGVYILHIQQNSSVIRKKIVLIK